MVKEEDIVVVEMVKEEVEIAKEDIEDAVKEEDEEEEDAAEMEIEMKTVQDAKDLLVKNPKSPKVDPMKTIEDQKEDITKDEDPKEPLRKVALLESRDPEPMKDTPTILVDINTPKRKALEEEIGVATMTPLKKEPAR